MSFFFGSNLLSATSTPLSLIAKRVPFSYRPISCAIVTLITLPSLISISDIFTLEPPAISPRLINLRISNMEILTSFNKHLFILLFEYPLLNSNSLSLPTLHKILPNPPSGTLTKFRFANIKPLIYLFSTF